MAGEELHNWLQERVDDLRELLEPIAMAVNDEAARREILAAVGLDPAQASQPLVVPPTALASIDAYRQRAPADADLQAFVSLVQDITQVVQAVIDLLGMAAANDPNAPPGFAAEQAVGALLSSLALGAIRVEQPGVYATIKALQLVEEQGVRFGGVVQLVFRTGEFFTELWGAASRLETDADAKRVSDVALFITGALLTGFLEGDYVYGYDAGPGSPSPLADAASNRTLTMRFSGTTKDQAGNTAKGSLTIGAVLVPAELGGAGLLMRLLAEGSLEVPFGDEKKKEKNLILRITASAPDLIFFIGGGDYQFPATTDASVGARLEYRSTKETPVIWGDPGGIHLRVGKLGLEGKVSTTDHLIKGEIRDSAFVLATKSADGFLKTVLDALVPNGKLETTFAFELGYSKKRGAFVGGGAGLLVAVPLHQTLGPLQLNTLTVGLAVGDRAGKEPGVKLEASLSFGLDLGVLQASVDRIGLSAMVGFEDREVTIGFKPPNGVGLAINAGVVRGGGFLSFDPDRGEYAGGVELAVTGLFNLAAIGLITTRMPDGSQGFSLLIIVSLELANPPVIGPGFRPMGAGGLLGLNRTMRLEPLAAGIRTGAASRILFPTNIVANAARIISDLRTFFPPENDTFLIGGMVKLGWGVPPLATISLGVVIQIPPGNFAILGVLRIVLPDEQAAILKLQVAFIGAVEFDKQRAWFFASLFDSTLRLLTIEGGMGVLVGWGADANFVVSVGGFHPQFRPPPLPFPVPDRLAINILNTAQARVRVTAYFAVTTNTVQFGARAELFFGLDDLSVEGHLAFDALFQFSPFGFIIEISASVSVKVFGAGLFSIRLRGSLEGVTPWRIAGSASISILFFEISVDVEHTWGEGAVTTVPSVRVMALLADELDKETSWRAELPASSNLLVSLRKLAGSEDQLVLHPLGALRVSQRAVPLEITVDKVGSQQAADANRFHLEVDAGGGLGKRGDTREQFAIAQFQELSNSQKLAAPAFQPEPGGVVLAAAGSQLRSSRLVKRRVRYELIILDSNFKRLARPFFEFWRNLFVHFVRGDAVAESELSQRRRRQLQPFADRIAVQEPGFTVARTRDNTAFAAEARGFGSEAEAREYLRRQVTGDRRLAKELHVICAHEVNEAA